MVLRMEPLQPTARTGAPSEVGRLNSTPPSLPPVDGAARRGAVHGVPNLDINTAIGLSFLPSLALEVAFDNRLSRTKSHGDHTTGTLSVEENGGTTSIPIHLIAHEVQPHRGGAEVYLARTNRALFNDLPVRTKSFLNTVHALAEERGFDAFERRLLRAREPAMPVPLGRALTGLIGEMLETPFTPFSLTKVDDQAVRVMWYLAENTAPDHALDQQGSEEERLRFCRDVIEHGFSLGRHLIEKPLEAFCAVGMRLGLIAGRSDEKTAFIMAPNKLDVTGERLALLVRAGSEECRIPGLEVCWAHHDSYPRPAATRR